MSDYLQLGPVSFQDFALPGRIRFGGKQRLAVHTLPGGVRVIAAMGRNDAEIAWRGAFSGADAADRARGIDLMRVEGSTWTLSWDAFCYLVVISDFDASYEHVNWVPYRISCTVVQDLAQSAVGLVASLATSVLGDLASVAGIDTSAAVAAVGAAGAMSAGTVAYAGAVSAVGSVVAQAQAGMSSAGASLLAAQDPATAATAAGQLASNADANGFAGRALANLDNAGA
jgi:hypothetical protein